MNKKLLTLCVSTLLAGGMVTPVFAESFDEAGKNIADGKYVAGQYFYVKVNEGDEVSQNPNPGNLDVNAGEDGGSEEGTYWSTQKNQSTWWRLEAVHTTVNGVDRLLGYKLINALTGKPLTAKASDGTV